MVGSRQDDSLLLNLIYPWPSLALPPGPLSLPIISPLRSWVRQERSPSSRVPMISSRCRAEMVALGMGGWSSSLPLQGKGRPAPSFFPTDLRHSELAGDIQSSPVSHSHPTGTTVMVLYLSRSNLADRVERKEEESKREPIIKGNGYLSNQKLTIVNILLCRSSLPTL